MTHRLRLAAESYIEQATVKGRHRFRIPISMNRNGCAQETADGCEALPRWGDDVLDFLFGHQKRSAPRTTWLPTGTDAIYPASTPWKIFGKCRSASSEHSWCSLTVSQYIPLEKGSAGGAVRKSPGEQGTQVKPLHPFK